jgi:alpha/beta superfamily hydrolase
MTGPAFPKTSETLLLAGPAGVLEVAVDPAGDKRLPVVAVVCHPLPTEGGTMYNKVVTMAARAPTRPPCAGRRARRRRRRTRLRNRPRHGS